MTEPPTPGSVVLVSAGDGIHLMPAIALTAADGAVAVVPVSSETVVATEWDLALEEGLLGYPAVAEAWNVGHVLVEQCRQAVAALAEAQLAHVEELLLAARRGDAPPDLSLVGPPVASDSDPRLLAQDERAEQAHCFWEPALALAGCATLGELITHRRADLGLSRAELEAASPGSGWLESAERDRIDFPNLVEPSALGTLLRRLEVGASSRLRVIAQRTLESVRPSLARGAEGAGDGARADAYLDQVLRSMGDEW